jgi:hypothetical protein
MHLLAGRHLALEHDKKYLRVFGEGEGACWWISLTR